MRIALATCSDLPDWEVDDRPLAAALAARGAEVVHAVWDDPEVDWPSFDACLIRTTWDYMEKREAYLRWAERVAKATRLFNPAAVVRWNTDKSYLGDLTAWGVPVVPTLWLPRGARVEIRGLLADRAWSAGFLKPTVGATSRETLRFATDEEGLASAQIHLDRLLPQEGMMLQPYLERVERDGELSAVFIDGAFSHAVRKIPPAGDYRVQDDFGARDEPVRLESHELALAAAVVAAVEGWPELGQPGPEAERLLYARTDFLRDDAGRLRLTELELVEPSLFFRHAPQAAELLADALCRRLGPRR